MSTDNLPTTSVFDVAPVSVETIQRQMVAIDDLKSKVMRNNVDYGVIPGCGDKPTLLKAGAERLLQLFRLRPIIRLEHVELEKGHREYTAYCDIIDPSGEAIGTGIGVCSTMESKYRWRKSERKCPQCGAEAIIKGKAQYGGGWVCFKKKGGCGAKYEDGDQEIESQIVGRVENPDIADQYNTVAKMAKKRSLVDGTLTTTGASGLFTQDVEDIARDVSWKDAVDVTPAAPRVERPSKAQLKELAEVMQSLGYNKSDIAPRISQILGREVKGATDLTREEYQECVAAIVDEGNQEKIVMENAEAAEVDASLAGSM